jgi:S-adenosylmethionine synthetase
MMFGYATNESDNYMPLTLEISHLLVQELARIRKENKVMQYLRPDAKSQVTIEYDDHNQPIRIIAIVVSTQHDDFLKADHLTDKETVELKMQAKIKEDILKYLLPAVRKRLPERVQKLFNDEIKYYINPTGVFIIGGPHGDSGLTGRKIIVDTYGGRGAHGGGAFSGKDPSKVDRSAAYAARHIAKNFVAAGLADQVLVQLSYAIGIAEPISINVNTFGTAKVKLTDSQISDKIIEVFKDDFKPKAIIERLKLKNPIYSATAAYGHMGRPSYEQDVELAYVTIEYPHGHKIETRKFETKSVEFFTWEKLDYIDKIKSTFSI